MSYSKTKTTVTNGKGPILMENDYKIHLNFLPIDGGVPDFSIYRKRRKIAQESRPRDGLRYYRLPTSFKAGTEQDWQPYWISVQKEPGFEEFKVSAKGNPYLTCYVLFWSLKKAASKVLQPEDYRVHPRSLIEELSLIQQVHPEEGQEELVVKPYYLWSTKQFGYLVDFHFRLADNASFSRRIQQLSLSLDKRYRRNLDYYADRLKKIREFLRQRRDVFNALPLPDTTDTMELVEDFMPLSASRLRTKVYQFADGCESKNQFAGLQAHGPLKPLENTPKLVFMFREQDRQSARLLAMSLRGTKSRDRFSFKGFDSLFRCQPVLSNDPQILPDLSRSSIERAVQRVKREDINTEYTIIPILVVPKEKDSYLIQKALFLRDKIPTQVCTLSVLQDENTLKWSIANIALQIFCKAGGYPWKVRPTNDKSLIIGISQSHKIVDREVGRSVEKYFAFSVMTDNSGLFQKISVLGEEKEQEGYVKALKENLRRVLDESAQDFSQVILHTSFKLKRKEIKTIQDVVSEVAERNNNSCRFAVVKVNQRTRFFGSNNNVNSLVPYEATKVQLGPHEYLIWFEGIFPDNMTVRKAFPGPTHIEIFHVPGQHRIPDEVLLQDLVNLSGANWRGFNAKNMPVSVFYCHLVANRIRDFHDLELPLPSMEDAKPWFL